MTNLEQVIMYYVHKVCKEDAIMHSVSLTASFKCALILISMYIHWLQKDSVSLALFCSSGT